METYYATFPPSTTLAKHYVRIDADSRLVAHIKMNQHYGMRWAFLYSHLSLDRLHDTGLTEVPFGTDNERV